MPNSTNFIFLWSLVLIVLGTGKTILFTDVSKLRSYIVKDFSHMLILQYTFSTRINNKLILCKKEYKG